METKNNDVEQKHNLKSAKKIKIRQRDFKEKRRQETKEEKRLMKENFVIEYFDVVLFLKQKQRRKKRKERDKKQGSKRKQKRKTGRKEKKGQEEERDRERKIEQGGGQKKAKEKQRQTVKNNQKMPFSRGKTRFCVLQSKERNKNKQKKNKKIINKEGLGPSEVAQRPLNPPKHKTTTTKTKKETKNK